MAKKRIIAAQQALGAGDRRNGDRGQVPKTVGRQGVEHIVMEHTASEAPRRVALSQLLWLTWVVGPASYGIAFVCYVVAPEWCYGYSDPGPDLCLAFIMIVTHLAAGMCTLLLLLQRGAHWRSAEFWLLLVYWAGIAGWILPAFWLSADRGTIAPTIPWLCSRVSVVAVVLMPVVAVARRAMGHEPSTRSG